MSYKIKYFHRTYENGNPYIWAELWDGRTFRRGTSAITETEAREFLENYVRQNYSPYKEEEIIVSI